MQAPTLYLLLLLVQSVNLNIQGAAGNVSKERLESTVRKLESFGTRSTFSDASSPTRGIGAARQWIYDQLKSLSPRLEVSFDTHPFTGLQRATESELRNVVAILPGTDPVGKERRILITAHYDSTSLQDPERAPGANDDGSGTAAVLEAARILSQREFPHTIVFVAFDGEEQGLAGSRLFAAKARKENWQIDAVLNNDIIGNSVGAMA